MNNIILSLCFIMSIVSPLYVQNISIRSFGSWVDTYKYSVPTKSSLKTNVVKPATNSSKSSIKNPTKVTTPKKIISEPNSSKTNTFSKSFPEQFYETFDTLPNKKFWSYEIVNSTRIEPFTQNFIEGSKSLKLTLNADDSKGRGERSEIALRNSDPVNTETRYQWYFNIPDSWKDNPKADWVLIGQWHDQPPAGTSWSNYPGHNPVISVNYFPDPDSSNNYIIRVYYGLNKGKKDNNRKIITKDLVLKKGDWQKIKFHIYWSEGNDGFAEVRINDKKINIANKSDGRYYGPNMYNSSPAYFKLGIYRDKLVDTDNYILLDNLKKDSQEIN